MSRPASDGAASSLVVAALFAWAVAGMAPSLTWMDTGNLAASSWVMGIAHPPGEVGWLVPARLAQLLPLGDGVFRTNLLSAFCVAALVWPLTALLRSASGPPESLAEGPLPLLVVVLGLGGFSAQLQAVRTEVYGLTTLLLIGALVPACAWPGRAGAALAGLLLGIAATVHPLLAAVCVPALATARVARTRRLLPDLGAAVGAGLVGFAAVAWLPLRARAIPHRAWGVPDDPQAFVDVLLARTFGRNFGESAEASAEWVANLGTVVDLWLSAGGLLTVALAVWGLFAVRTPTARALAAALPLWVLGNLSTILPQNKVLPDNPDLHGYLLVGFVAVAAAAGVGLAAVMRGRTLGLPGWPILLGALVVGWLQLADGTRAHRPDDWRASRFSTELATHLPPGAVLMTGGNDPAFAWAWLGAVERRRADLVVVHRVLLGHEHERRRLGGLDAVGLPWSPELQLRPTEHLQNLSRPFYLEVREAEAGALADGRLLPHGLVAAWAGRPTAQPPPEPARLVELRAAVLAELAEAGPEDRQAAAVAAYFEELRSP